jgi:hypothetical protein
MLDFNVLAMGRKANDDGVNAMLDAANGEMVR